MDIESCKTTDIYFVTAKYIISLVHSIIDVSIKDINNRRYTFENNLNNIITRLEVNEEFSLVEGISSTYSKVTLGKPSYAVIFGLFAKNNPNAKMLNKLNTAGHLKLLNYTVSYTLSKIRDKLKTEKNMLCDTDIVTINDYLIQSTINDIRIGYDLAVSRSMNPDYNTIPEEIHANVIEELIQLKKDYNKLLKKYNKAKSKLRRLG